MYSEDNSAGIQMKESRFFKSLISALILKESIKTTSEKAKAIKGEVDKLINKAKRGTRGLQPNFYSAALELRR